ncbi:hypothetical protein Sru01_39310 [Sphaerisporangium rufum]|uniref:PDZ domain-containing protein n=1 Tax=Sphaerisporangium rufum TaxID=1381558 RepID=A0A919R3L4_9ACTN|nr:S41 family peptidase [Sphaerisporangium rufum]GII78949.1 hypothetical protein Sru01_39310 [Sphaerisporangium rufum]
MSGIRSAAAGIALVLAAGCTAPAAPRAQASPQSTVCPAPAGAPGPETATTVEVIEQVYFCILGTYYSGATLDARLLLTAAFTALTRELNRAGREVAGAVMPPLTGDRQADWAAFAAAWRTTTGQVPGLRDRLAVATVEAMVAALDDDHARWTHGLKRPPGYYDGDGYGLGLRASARRPDAALPPLFVTAVEGGAARAAGLRPGDIIESVDGSAPFIGGRATAAAIDALYPSYPQAAPVRLRMLRRSTGRRWNVTLKPGLYPRDPATLRAVTGRPLARGVAYVRLTGFSGDAADRVLREIARMRAGRTLTGVLLDLRGNGGGSPAEAIRLLSAFVHGKVTAYLCTAAGACQAARTDDTVELLGLPLVVLVDGGCASACEHFSSAVKDLRAGRLVGTRTAGAVSGPAEPHLLADNTVLTLPARHHLGPGREVVDRIGVPPDHHVPLTAKDAAAGRDPALERALSLLHE